MTITTVSKRRLLCLGGAAAAGITAPALLIRPALADAAGEQRQTGKAEAQRKPQITPPEDLMREHGVLDRVLLAYEAMIRKFASNQDFDPALISQSAEIIREFINDYHEKTEEDHVFPRFRKAARMVDLVDTLVQQHHAGRKLTETIIGLAPASRTDQDERRRLVAAMQSFITMYRPHAAREDTDLFPLLKDLVSANEYDAMAEEFENKEHRLFGDDGLAKMAARIAVIERKLGIHQLEQFTPQL